MSVAPVRKTTSKWLSHLLFHFDFTLSLGFSPCSTETMQQIRQYHMIHKLIFHLPCTTISAKYSSKFRCDSIHSVDHLQHIMTKTKQLQIFFRFIYIRELITEFRCEARNIIASNVVDYCLADAINGICVYTCAKCVFVCVCWRPKMFWRTESHSIAHKHKYARIDTRPPRYFQLVLTNCISLTHIHMCAGAHSHIRSVVFVER